MEKEKSWLLMSALNLTVGYRNVQHAVDKCNVPDRSMDTLSVQKCTRCRHLDILGIPN